MVAAFAHTIVDDTHRTAVRGKARSSFPGRTSTPPSVPLPEIGDVVGGHYRLDSLLGQGMFGKVYVAQRLDVPEHRVALKLLPRSLYAGRNVERELVMLATVGHPNVVQLKDHGTTPDYVWLTMPVYQGQTLAERLEKGTLSPKQAYDIFLPMARGLEAAPRGSRPFGRGEPAAKDRENRERRRTLGGAIGLGRPILCKRARFTLSGEALGAALSFRVLALDPSLPNGQSDYTPWLAVTVGAQ